MCFILKVLNIGTQHTKLDERAVIDVLMQVIDGSFPGRDHAHRQATPSLPRRPLAEPEGQLILKMGGSPSFFRSIYSPGVGGASNK